MRLSRERDIRRVLKRGSRARGRDLVLVACQNDLEHSRLGISFGRRIYRRAVDRNRQRRIVKEAFRLTRSELPLGFDFLVLGARPSIVLKLEPTQRELQRLAHKAVARYREKVAGSQSEA